MNSYPNILIRCDGSRKIGLGHIERCLALAKELKKQYNCNSVFAMRKSDLGISIVQKKYPVSVAEEASFDYENWLSGCIEKNNIDVLILDVRDNLDNTILEKLKQKYTLLIIDIDDPENKRKSADKVFYPPVLQINEMDWTGFKGILYCGWEYVILRNEFQNEFPDPVNDLPTILVTMGATDPENLTIKVLKAIQLLNHDISIKILIGPGYGPTDELKYFANSWGDKIEILEGCNNVAQLMSQVDLAIASFGVTAYELASIGVPSIFLCLSEDHNKSASIFVEYGLGINLGVHSHVSDQMILGALNIKLDELSENPGKTRGKKIVCSGNKSIAKIIMEGIHGGV